MEIVIGAMLSYLISLAANLRTDAIVARRADHLKEQLEQEEALAKALASTRPLRTEIHLACTELARNRAQLGVTKKEEPLWQLLNDEVFQADITEWFMAGGIEEGEAVKGRLLETMKAALTKSGASQDQIASLETGYFDALDKVVFGHPILAHWRHQLSLDYLREQVVVLQQFAEEAAGIYSPQKQEVALDRYCEKALTAWDIIDLSNLPEGDIHMATQKLLLRQLYLPLRIAVEPASPGEGDDIALARLEQQREVRRHREAGHVLEDESDQTDRAQSREPVGERLDTSNRLVVLGDPGSGKTTMLRWMATAYLLKYKGDDAFKQVPDTDTLPDRNWIPVLIRCRDLGPEDLCRSFTDFLTQHLNKSELLPDDAKVMRAVVLDRIAKGEALLLVDGLDEISDPYVRTMFCQELERTAARYPHAPIIVTSRIVGYRDMPYRMGSGFEHGVIAELNRDDKDLFARRWVEITEQHRTAAEKDKLARELLDSLHSSDRIERLTGNPMLLTTLALVKRKVGKLPSRRNKLYAEAVSVLLNWNPVLYPTIDEEEAIPQLEYLAYEMCRLGVQRLTDGEALDLLEKLRVEYPNIRAIRHQSPEEFLALLEARSSILIKSGGIWQNGEAQENPVWEFRHLTFQEYLAACALVDGRYPDRDKTKSLAEQVAPLAGAVEKSDRGGHRFGLEEEIEVLESWREALRLLVTACNDDDVDEVLLAILNPLPQEDSGTTDRPRTVLAGLCLADEPNVSEENAKWILAKFAAQIGEGDGNGVRMTSLDRAAIEIGGSMWLQLLEKSLIHEYCKRSSEARGDTGGVWATVAGTCMRRSGVDSHMFFTALVTRLKSSDRVEKISAALTVMEAAFDDTVTIVDDLVGTLLDLLSSAEPPIGAAAAWALGWLAGGPSMKPGPKWVCAAHELNRVVQAFETADPSEISTRRWLARVLGSSKDSRALSPLIGQMDDPDTSVRRTIIKALVQLGDKQAVPPLLAKLDDSETSVRTSTIEALAQLGDKQAVPPLLAKLDDPETSVRLSVVKALAQLGDKQAVPPLLVRLDDPETSVRLSVVKALAQLGDKQAVPTLLAKQTDSDGNIREAVIQALGQLGGKQAKDALISLLEDRDHEFCATAAGALANLGDNRGSIALTELLEHDSPERRQDAVKGLVRMRAKSREEELLSRDFDRADPWIDPKMPITETRIENAARKLGITVQEVRSFYEAIAVDYHLSFASN